MFNDNPILPFLLPWRPLRLGVLGEINSEENSARGRRRRVLFLLFDVVFLPEALYAAGGVNQFLLAGKERMAGGADFHLDVLGCGTGLNHVPADAGNRRHFIFGMYLFFHSHILQVNSFIAHCLNPPLRNRCSWIAGMLHYSCFSSFCQPAIL